MVVIVTVIVEVLSATGREEVEDFIKLETLLLKFSLNFEHEGVKPGLVSIQALLKVGVSGELSG